MLTAGQEDYRGRLLAAAREALGRLASTEYQRYPDGRAKITVVFKARDVCRVFVDRQGKLLTAWDPRCLTDKVEARGRWLTPMPSLLDGPHRVSVYERPDGRFVVSCLCPPQPDGTTRRTVLL